MLSLFLFCMTAALQYAAVMGTAVQFAGALSETGKEMAAAAYLYEYPEDAQERGPGIAVSALSAAWAHRQIMNRCEGSGQVRNANMALSSFLQGDQMIDLVLTYQVKSPFRVAGLPAHFFLQRAIVRAWTGRRAGSSQAEGDGGGTDGEDTVYVTVTGSVYHEDPECTHLKLSVRETDHQMLESLRNKGGAKYHPCERCDPHAEGIVYITNEGNRYHATLGCSGLKRTVKEMTREEAGTLPACSKCGSH